jgi:hypothetical protein
MCSPTEQITIDFIQHLTKSRFRATHEREGSVTSPINTTGPTVPNNRIRPPWIKTSATRNIAKRARLKRLGLAPKTSKAATRRLIHDGMQHWVGEIKREVDEQIAAETKF